jgi:AraC-like DNA-binding protein
VAVDYDKQPAPLTLYYMGPLDGFGDASPVLTPDGDLLVAGGIIGDNFSPLASVWLLHTGTPKTMAIITDTQPYRAWIWVLCGVMLVGIAVVIVRRYVRLPHCDSPTEPSPQPNNASDELMTRITQLMETQHLYLNPELKITDVADALGVHRNAVSACINAQGYTFNQFINDYRLKHAKQLLCQTSDMKISTVASESGFANESTFFRAFKADTGMTPKEWVAQQQAVS